MKHLVIFIISILLTYALFAQKKVPLQIANYEAWEHVGGQQISNDGNFVLYTISSSISSRMIIQSTITSWKKEIQGATSPLFTENSQYVLFSIPGDSLGIMELRGGRVNYLSNITGWKRPGNGSSPWIAFQRKDKVNQLVLRNIYSGEEKVYSNVKNYTFSNRGKKLLFQTINKINDSIVTGLQLVNLDNMELTIIWQGNEEVQGDCLFDNSEDQLAFITSRKIEGQEKYALRYYRVGMDIAIVKVDDNVPEIETSKSFLTNNVLKFSNDGRRIYFSVLPRADSLINKPDGASINIWHYKDVRLQSDQLMRLKKMSPANLRDRIRSQSEIAVLNILNNKVIRLEQNGEKIVGSDISKYSGEYILVKLEIANPRESFWLNAARPSYFLISLEDGSKKELPLKNMLIWGDIEVSPNGRYVVWYDRKQKNYFSYNTDTDTVTNITKEIPAPIFNEDNDKPGASHPVGKAAWISEGEALLVYGKFDIWEVDLRGRKKPVNITMNYGKKNRIFFRFLPSERESLGKLPIYSRGENTLIMGFNDLTKDNGFFKVRAGVAEIPKQLTMGPYAYWFYSLPSSDLFGTGDKPIKAKNAEAYLLMRKSASEAPNLWFTADGRTISQISSIEPQKNYNWMTSTLVKWKMPDGKIGEGILYKPEDFDPNKRYPMIIHFYERLSNGLNNFIYPSLSEGTLNIPFFVSNGYVVFIPNIYYRVGYTGQSVVNAVVSATKYLMKKPWIDSTKIGIQGHSFGGYEVNYLVTHTKVFAAAASNAGQSDFISGYGQLDGVGISRQAQYEDYQSRIGVTLWERPDLYIRNSPIFNVNCVQTPLLIMHNREDGQVPWEQGIEFFTALRRLGKKAWMLEYDDEGHILTQGKNQLDYSIRLAQFFDYYLKRSLPPKWMVEGVPAKLKGVDMGTELDTSGKEP